MLSSILVYHKFKTLSILISKVIKVNSPRVSEVCSAEPHHTIHLVKDPGCRNLISTTEDQQELADTIQEYVENLCPNVVSEILSRVLSYNGETKRKASPLDVWALMHPG